MNLRPLIINLSNLPAGGAVQVASSLLEELSIIADTPSSLARWPWLTEAKIEASSAVLDNCARMPPSLSIDRVDRRPLAQILNASLSPRYEVAFTLFGPSYSGRIANVEIVGFADGTSLFPELSANTTKPQRIRQVLRRTLSRALFSRADQLIVEAPHVAAALSHRWGIGLDRIDVVPNVLHPIFTMPQTSTPAPFMDLPQGEVWRMFLPSRSYPHKNIDILGKVAVELKRRHGKQVEFVLTLNQNEWDALPADVQATSISTGPLLVTQLPSLYEQVDAVIFPSINECFSITPLEALVSRRPLAASNRDFVKSITKDAAWYFDPQDPRDIADTISEIMTTETGPKVSNGYALAVAWPSSRDRARAYLDIIGSTMG